MGIAYNTSIVRDGLVLHLDAANLKSYPGSGTTWKDLGGNGNDGTLQNGVGYTGNNKGVMTFDGSNQVCTTGLSPSVLGTFFTACVFFYKSGVGGANATANRIITADRSGNSTKWTIGIKNNGDLQFAGGGGNDGQPSFSFPLNEFRFCAVSHNSNTYSFFINDEKVINDRSSPIGSGDNNTIAVGGRPQISDRFFDGGISSVQVYNRALTESEIKKNYEALRSRYGI